MKKSLSLCSITRSILRRKPTDLDSDVASWNDEEAESSSAVGSLPSTNILEEFWYYLP